MKKTQPKTPEVPTPATNFPPPSKPASSGSGAGYVIGFFAILALVIGVIVQTGYRVTHKCADTTFFEDRWDIGNVVSSSSTEYEKQTETETVLELKSAGRTTYKSLLQLRPGDHVVAKFRTKYEAWYGMKAQRGSEFIAYLAVVPQKCEPPSTAQASPPMKCFTNSSVVQIADFVWCVSQTNAVTHTH